MQSILHKLRDKSVEMVALVFSIEHAKLGGTIGYQVRMHMIVFSCICCLN
jgi:hypothetical protein